MDLKIMGIFGFWQWIVVLIIVIVLFGGRGKLSSILGDLGKGLRAFRQEVKEKSDDEDTDDEKSKTNTLKKEK